MNPSIPKDARYRTESASRAPDDSASASRLADYIADVFFIALLAAPFLIFEVPATIRDAVLAAAAERPAIVSHANASQAPVTNASTPVAPASDAYGPE
jgi:hypothetical protein